MAVSALTEAVIIFRDGGQLGKSKSRVKLLIRIIQILEKHFKNNFQKKTGMASTRQGLEEMIQHGVKQEQQMARAHLAGYS